MPAIVQHIYAPAQGGKTFLLTHLAKGYASAGRRVLYVEATKMMADSRKKTFTGEEAIFIDVVAGSLASVSAIKGNRYSAVLIDNIERFGDCGIVEQVKNALSGYALPIPVLVTRCAPAVDVPAVLDALRGLERMGYLTESPCAGEEGNAALARAEATEMRLGKWLDAGE